MASVIFSFLFQAIPHAASVSRDGTDSTPHNSSINNANKKIHQLSDLNLMRNERFALYCRFTKTEDKSLWGCSIEYQLESKP